MLQLLHIENIAVIERADISFRAGFNALTGETGAGKSIVIDSLGAVLGARTSRDLIRTGAAKAFVSAEFDGVDASLPVLAALGVEPEDGVLLLQRDIYADGKNICRANGRPITVAQLRALGTSLLNIHGQHEGTQLLDEEQHGAYLDRFARLDGLQEAYTERYQAARETRRQIEALQMDEAEKARRVDTLRHQIAELERAELPKGAQRAGCLQGCVYGAEWIFLPVPTEKHWSVIKAASGAIASAITDLSARSGTMSLSFLRSQSATERTYTTKAGLCLQSCFFAQKKAARGIPQTARAANQIRTGDLILTKH